MGIIFQIIFFFINIPARLKGVKFGKGSYFGPGYDFFSIRMKGIELANKVIIGRNARILLSSDDKSARINIGEGTIIGRNVTMAAVKNISLGKKCLLSFNISFYDHDHVFRLDIPPTDSGLTKGDPIIIGNECFIGAHSFILKGVHLGNHCVVGANSVVTKSFPDNSIIAGSPARLIGTNK